VSLHIFDPIFRSISDSKPFAVGNSELVPPMILQSRAKPPETWLSSELESALAVRLPEDLKLLWSKASEIRLHEDVNYGQWGCVLWSPSELITRHHDALSWRGTEDFRQGDLIIGEFRGDTDLLIVRCDPTKDDFGNVVIALAMDPRDKWPYVGTSIAEFMSAFLANPQQKFWEVSN